MYSPSPDAVEARRCSIHVVIRHPVPLVATGAVVALSRQVDITTTLWHDGLVHAADVVLTDHETGLRLAGERRGGHRAVKLAVIGSSGRVMEVRTAMQAGIEGYVVGMCSVAELVACVRAVASGRHYLSDSALQCIADGVLHEALTPRELAVLQCLCEALSNKAIAKRLRIGLGTVKTHVTAIFDKLEVDNRTHAVHVALSRGWVRDPRLAREHAPPVPAAADATTSA